MKILYQTLNKNLVFFPKIDIGLLFEGVHSRGEHFKIKFLHFENKGTTTVPPPAPSTSSSNLNYFIF
jgi:hypothetical protein